MGRRAKLVVVATALCVGALLAAPMAWAATAPGAPTSAVAQPKDGSAVVSWSAPSSDGGSPITGYRVTTIPGATTTAVAGAASSATITGLANGTSYTFTVVAFNAVGAGPASTATAPVAPSGVPGAPTGVSALADNAQATVAWVAPTSDGGAPITAYTVTAAPGGKSASAGGTARTATVTGLTNGTSYTFTVKATNARGSSPASAPSVPVTVGVPGAPTGVSATAGTGQATVSWTAPSSTGGSTITGYTVTAAPGGKTASAGGAARTATVTGLTNGTSYTFTVRATNARGTGPASAPSSAVVPGLPGRPLGVTVVPGNAQVTVSWTAPTASGGSPISAYTVTAAPGGAAVTVSGGERSATVAGLTNDVSYTFTVRASNAYGTGVTSSSDVVTPFVREVRRLAGASRVMTAITLSQDRWATASSGASPRRSLAQAVVLARSDDYADVLAGAALASQRGGPLLLTPPDSLDAAVLGEIARILPRGGTVHLLGGTAALSTATESAVRAAGFQVVRYAGRDRFATAVRIADIGLGNPSVQLVVTGTDFADALAAGAAAAHAGAAVLLTDGSQLPAATADYLRSHSGTRFAIGGAAAKAYKAAEVIAGVDRYETAVRVARRFFSAPAELGVASGTAFPDALAGSAHSGSRGGPLLLVSAKHLPTVVQRYLAERRSHSVIVDLYGGTAAVSGLVKIDIERAIT